MIHIKGSVGLAKHAINHVVIIAITNCYRSKAGYVCDALLVSSL